MSTSNCDPPAKAKKSPSAEKRLKPYRIKPTIGILQRIERAKTQRLYLVERSEVRDSCECDFVVLGSTGNVYNVTVGQIPTCSCPDHLRGNLCKHILFIFLKVVGLDDDSPHVYQAALLKSELEHIFSLMTSRRVGGSVMANDQVQQTYTSLKKGDIDEPAVAGVTRKSLEADSDCPICFDSMDGGAQTSLTYCRAMCGTNFHHDCIKRWLGQNRQKPTCPACRQQWDDGLAKFPGKVGSKGYTNLGDLQGQSRQRDDSTYSEWYHMSPDSKRRRRW